MNEPKPRPGLVRFVKVGDELVNKYGDTATVIDLLPDDPDYFARLETPSGETFCAISENYATWRRKP